MKQIQKPPIDRLKPFRKLAVAACLVSALGCGGANQSVVPDYWGARHTDVSHTKARLTSIFREKTVDVAGAKVSFVIPNNTLSNLDQASKRHEEGDERNEAFYAHYLSIGNVMFGSGHFSRVTFSYAIEKGEHHIAIAFDEKLDPNPQLKEFVGIRKVDLPEFRKLSEKLGGEIHGINFMVETVGIPTTIFGVPLDSKNQPIGRGEWGQLVIGASFNPSRRELIARPAVIVAEGKTREEARDAFVQRLSSP